MRLCVLVKQRQFVLFIWYRLNSSLTIALASYNQLNTATTGELVSKRRLSPNWTIHWTLIWTWKWRWNWKAARYSQWSSSQRSCWCLRPTNACTNGNVAIQRKRESDWTLDLYTWCTPLHSVVEKMRRATTTITTITTSTTEKISSISELLLLLMLVVAVSNGWSWEVCPNSEKEPIERNDPRNCCSEAHLSHRSATGRL